MTDSFYITTAIDYSNGDPHLGHAFEKIGADCIARYRRLRGQEVRFVTGMDEHGEKVAQSAEAAGISPQQWVDDIADRFIAQWAALHISNTDFLRTTQPRHRASVEELFRRIRDAGYLSKGVYEGYYCIGCEGFKLERELENGKCPIHPTRKIDWLSEPNYFFQVGKFRDRLLALYESRPEFVRPKAKYNEIVNVVTDWTEDQTISVSRANLPWGIPWPGDPEHTVYVWFEAVINYLTATGFPAPGFEARWPADVHVIGPDILRFHAALWPAMLMAAGLEVPGQVWCHGWVKTSGTRFSKSEGVSVRLDEITGRYGPDAMRYFLLREVPWDADGNFSFARFDARYTAELADGYGNLASRVLAMIVKYTGGVVPNVDELTSLDTESTAIVADYAREMDQHLLHRGATEAWRLVSLANGFVEESAPWALAKSGQTERLNAVLGSLAAAVARITVMAFPFMPEKTQLVWDALGFSDSLVDARWDQLEHPRVRGQTVEKPPPLFPKPESG